MKISGRTIKRRLYKLRNLPDEIKRARYFRGHGVHSPFVYSIVRQVFMRSSLVPSAATTLYDALLLRGVPRSRAIELQNLMTHCRYTTFGIDCADDKFAGCDMVVVTTAVAAEQLASMAASAQKARCTLAVIAPLLDRNREQACRQIVESHDCTSVDNRGYLLLFNNYLPKQTFRL